jgi:hypothetical protein
MKKIHSVIFTFIVCITLMSCKDNFVEQQPIGSFPESVLNTPDGISMALTGAYSALNGAGGMARGPGNILFGSIRGGEAHKGSSSGDQPQMIEIQKFAVNAGNSSVNANFTFYYDAVYRTNLVLANLPNVTGLSDAQKAQIAAEARFLRGHYMFFLKRLYRNVPFVDETSIADPRVPNTDESGNFVDAWPAIAADFKFAAENLAPTNADKGRANKWAAVAYLGKTYLYMGNEGDNANYALAQAAFNDVMQNGVTNSGTKYALNADYHANFNSLTENGPEAVFAVQHSVNDGSTSSNANSSLDMQYISPQSGNGPGDNRGYGFFYPSQWFVNHFRVDANGLPIFDDAARNADKIKSDDGIPAADPYTPDAGLIDPRLDWSVGRRGIPFLDYGQFSPTWIRDATAAGPYLSQKFFTSRAANGLAASRPENNLNINVIRFADVLLMAAEVEARIGSLDLARSYVNDVRGRMATNTTSKENWVLLEDGTPAANYKIGLYPVGSPQFASPAKALEAIFFERTLELGLEGHRAYDAIRFGAEDGTTDTKELNGYIAYESTLKGYLSGGVYTRTPDAIMPIPQQAIDNSFKDGKYTLEQNPDY